MSFHLTSQVHESSLTSELAKEKNQDSKITITSQIDVQASTEPADAVNYMARAQWLRAAVLGANDGLVSVASLMIGVGAVNESAKAMLVSGLAGLVAGACSMAIGEFVSVYAQYDLEVAELGRRGRDQSHAAEEDMQLPNPLVAAGASALAFAAGALLPLLAGGFIKGWWARLGVVAGVSSFGLAGFGAAGAVLGGSSVPKSAIRVLVGGCLAMLVTYGMLRLFGLAFNMKISSA